MIKNIDGRLTKYSCLVKDRVTRSYGTCSVDGGHAQIKAYTCGKTVTAIPKCAIMTPKQKRFFQLFICSPFYRTYECVELAQREDETVLEEENAMPDIDDYYAFKSTGGGSGVGSGGGGSGCGWIVIVIVVLMLIFFIADGASWAAIDTLLGLGFLAFLCARFLFR